MRAAMQVPSRVMRRITVARFLAQRTSRFRYAVATPFGAAVGTSARVRAGSPAARVGSGDDRGARPLRPRPPPRERVASADEPAPAAYKAAIQTGDPDDLRRADAAERLLSRVYGRPME